jgi:hypothetical protein
MHPTNNLLADTLNDSFSNAFNINARNLCAYVLFIMEEQIVEILDAHNQCWVIAEVLDIDIANAKFMARYGDRPLQY